MTQATPQHEKDPADDAGCAGPAETDDQEGGACPQRDSEHDASSFFRQVNIEFLVHELKDPVSVIETGARMLLEKQSPSHTLGSRQKRTVARILRGAAKTREMLNELLEVGRAENDCFNPQPFNPITVLYKTLLEVVERDDPMLFEEIKQIPDLSNSIAVLSKRGIRIDIAPSAEGRTIDQDRIKFSQIVGNLIKNGFYYRRRILLVHLSYQRNQLSIAVRDDGPGIAPEHHEEIFERYKQVMASAEVARSGHGLGLAVARILARAMGGDITIDSELGQGALFKFVLPIPAGGEV